MIRPLLKVIFYLALLVGLYACIIKYFAKDKSADFNPKVIEILKSVGEDRRTVIVSKPDTIIVISRADDKDSGDYSNDPDVKFVSGDKVINKNQPKIDAGVKDGLVAYYPFNGNANDASGNKNHGIVHGATLTEDRFGNPKSAYYFDGMASVSISDNPSLRPAASLTLCAWVKIDNINSDNYLRIISKHGEVTEKGGSHGSYQLLTGRPNERGKFYTTLKTDARYFSTNPRKNVTNGDWHFVVSTWDGSRVANYVDCILISEDYATGRIQYDSNPLYIGKDGFYTNAFFKGKIDEVRIYSRNLDFSEIIKLYEAKQ
jgi:hypothetical protein